MSVPDVLRWLVFILGCFSIVTLAVFYEHVGRFILPRATVRLVILSCGLLAVSVMVDAMARLGEPIHLRTPVSLATMVLYVVGLVRLNLWFRKPDGRKRRHAIVNEFLGDQMIRNPEAYEVLRAALERDPAHAGRLVQPGPLHRFICRLVGHGKT